MINVNSRSRNLSLDTTAPPAYKPSTTSHASALSPSEALPDYCSGTEIKPLSAHVPATASSTSTPTVAVHLDQPSRIYDVDDIITGRIVFTPRRDCVLGSINATLAGEERTSKTHWVSQSTLQKTMRLAQHTVSPSAFPQGSIARKGFAYSFTFSMQVPLILQGSESQCRCSRCGGENNGDKDCHNENGQAAALIPPSLGSSPTEGQGYLEQPVCIYYFINASVMTLSVSPDPSIPATADTVYSCDYPPVLSIVPSYPNFPKTPSYSEITTTPANQSDHNRSTTTKKVKTSAEIRRGLLKSNAVGHVELALSDEPLILSADASDVSYARFTLTFIPSASAACEVPPKLTNFVSKLVATTRYAVPSDDDTFEDASATSPTSTNSNWDNSYYTETLPVSQLATHRPTWTRHNHLGSASYYSCTLTLPLSLPYHRNTVPSFRSRYVQRSYRLKVSVGLGATSLAVWAPVCVTSSFVPKSYYSVPIVGSLSDRAMMMQQSGLPLQSTNASNGGTGCVHHHHEHQRQQPAALPLVKATY